MIQFYLGGLVASGCIFLAEAAAADEPPGFGELVAVVLWPLTIVAFVIDVAKGWRA